MTETPPPPIQMTNPCKEGLHSIVHVKVGFWVFKKVIIYCKVCGRKFHGG